MDVSASTMGPLQEEKDCNNTTDYAPSSRDLGNSGRAGEEGGKERKERWEKNHLHDSPFILAQDIHTFSGCPAGTGSRYSTASSSLTFS